MATGGGRFLKHQVSGRRHELEMTVGQARHPGLRLGCRAQPVIRSPQHKGRHSDAMQPVGELGVTLRVDADQFCKAADFASQFNQFYRDCPVLTAEPAGLRGARIDLVDAARVVLRNALDGLGLSAPREM